MNFFDDMILVYKKALQKTCIRIKKNPIILILPCIFGICYEIAMRIFQIMIPSEIGLARGFLMPVLFSLILSAYYTMLSDLNFYNQVSFKNLSSSFKNFFSSIYSVYFFIILLSWFMPAFSTNMIVYLFIYGVLYIVFNPIAEIIYIRGDYYVQAYTTSLDFMKNNAILWLLPLVIYLGVTQLLGFLWSDMVLQSSIIDIPLQRSLIVPFILMEKTRIVPAFLMEIIGAFYIVFRGALFDILHKSSRRKRAYMGDNI